MNDNGIDGDLIAGDDIFLGLFPTDAGDFVQYYIRKLVNDESISLSPEK